MGFKKTSAKWPLTRQNGKKKNGFEHYWEEMAVSYINKNYLLY